MPQIKALGNAEKLLREITSSSLDAIYIKDRESRWLYANSSLEQIASKPSSELLGKTDAEIYSNPEVGRTILEHDKKVMESGRAETFEEFVDLPDGRHFFISVKSPRFDEKGNVIGILGISHDITNRKRREEALKYNNERLNLLSEVTSKLLSSSNPQSIIQEICEQVMSFLNCDVFFNFLLNEKKERLHLNAYAGVPAEVAKTFEWLSLGEAVCGCAAQEGERIVCENIPDSQDHRTALVSSFGVKAYCANPIFSDGKVIGTLSFGTKKKPFFTDEELSVMKTVTAQVSVVMQRKKAEEALRESEQLYKTIFDNGEDGFVLVEPLYDENNHACDIRFLQLNLAYEQQTGTKAAKVDGKRAKEVAPNLEQEWISLSGEVSKTGKPREIESFNQRTNKWYNANYIPFTRGRVGILFRDVTVRKNLEKQLQEKERLAVIGATAGMVGHDIRNPLQAIASDVFLLKSDLTGMPEGKMKEEVQESLDGIEANVDYINKIVQDLQDYARPVKPSPREISLENICEDVLFKNGVPENIDASCQVEEKVKRIMVDPEVLKRILSNLVTNAFQAMPNGGRIVVHAYQESGNTVITVQDTGNGISEDIRPKLFTPLFTTKSKGQGFGLAVVKRMTEALGGVITLESKVGEGAMFIVRLPSQKE